MQIDTISEAKSMTRTQEIKGLRFTDSEGKLDVKEFINIVKFFDKYLMVGAELERVVPISNERTSRLFGCSNSEMSSRRFEEQSYKSARARNIYNVPFVIQDGSFEYGNEIIFGGNNESFQWNYEKLKLIEDKLNTKDAIAYSPKTSTHISVLTAYNMKLKGTIIKNIFNMVRAYSSALYWLGSGDKTTILRRGAREYANHSLAFTPDRRPAKDLSQLISKNHQVNLSKQTFIPHSESELDGLFVEFRCTDGIRVPSVIASLMQLYKAIVYKAVEMSMDGVVQVESLSSDWRKNKIIANKLLTHNYELTREEVKFLTTESRNLINQCMNYLKRGDKSCISVLDKLAEKPVSIRLRTGQTNNTIDKELYRKERTLNDKEQKLLNILIKVEVKGNNIVDWKKKTATKLSCSVRYVEKMLVGIMDITKLSVVYDCEQKTMRID